MRSYQIRPRTIEGAVGSARRAVLRFACACIKDGPTFASPPALTGSSMSNFATARQKMVDGQVRTSDVTDRRILDAMLSLPREIFVPEARRALAYLDLDLDVGIAGSKRFLIKPMLTARLLQAAEIRQTDKVL